MRFTKVFRDHTASYVSSVQAPDVDRYVGMVCGSAGKVRNRSCGASEVLRIVYGLPDVELAEEAELGKVALGGCVITGEDPEWQCAKCGREWGRANSQ